MSSKLPTLALYKSLIRESKKFQSYNFRNYALRRVRDAFRENKNLTDQKKIDDEFLKGVTSLAVIKRQVHIGQMYETDKLVIEKISGVQ